MLLCLLFAYSFRRHLHTYRRPLLGHLTGKERLKSCSYDSTNPSYGIEIDGTATLGNTALASPGELVRHPPLAALLNDMTLVLNQLRICPLQSICYRVRHRFAQAFSDAISAAENFDHEVHANLEATGKTDMDDVAWQLSSPLKNTMVAYVDRCLDSCFAVQPELRKILGNSSPALIVRQIDDIVQLN